jgi:hypothetical protein
MEQVGLFYTHWEYSMAIYVVYLMYSDLVIIGSFGIFSPVLVYCAKKNLATLPVMQDFLL